MSKTVMVRVPQVLVKNCPANTLLRHTIVTERLAIFSHRGDQNCGPNLRSVHSPQAQRRPSSSSLRPGCMQTPVQSHFEPLLVRLNLFYCIAACLSDKHTARSTFEADFGFVRSVFKGMHSRPTTRISRTPTCLQNFCRSTRPSNTH